MTPFHAYYKARMLESQSDTDKIIPAYASFNIEVYPYQIAAAEFALRSLYLPGVICADECSLGKTFVALLVATQKWYEGRERLLFVLPVNLVGQWVKKIENSFTIPYVLLQNQEAFNRVKEENPFIGEGIVATTYEFAAQKAEYIKLLKWDLVIFDEAVIPEKLAYPEMKQRDLVFLLLVITIIIKLNYFIHALEAYKSSIYRLLNVRNELAANTH